MIRRGVIALLAILVGASCSDSPTGVPVVEYTVEVVAEHPHDTTAFTQGLAFADGKLYESTGGYGQSLLREVDLATGLAVREVALDDTYFGEGMTVIGDKVAQLTWKKQRGFVWDRDTFERLGTFDYPGEGWGLADDEAQLFMSDGTASLYVVDPETFERTRQVEVRDERGPVWRLNELEVIDGAVWANVWKTDTIVIIDPRDGAVTGRVDLSSLLAPADQPSDVEAVLNGIAYDAVGDRIFVTGKLWPKLFEIRLVPR